MDQLKHMGILEIFTQSFKTIFKCNKIFTQITLNLILPLATIFIANMDIPNRDLHIDEDNPYHVLFQAYKIYNSSYHADKPADLSHHWVFFLCFLLISVASFEVFYIYSTTSVVYTVTSIYTGDEVTYTTSIKVVAKVWRKVTINFSIMLLILALYTMTMIDTSSRIVLLVIYIFGYLYLSMVCQLASVISVLEDCKWREVLRAMTLVKGKMLIAAFVISFTLYVFFSGVVFMYMALVVYSELLVVWRVLIGIICGVLLMFGFLFNMVIYTILYLVCKSYQGEVIDPVNLLYLADSQPDEKPQNPPVSKV